MREGLKAKMQMRIFPGGLAVVALAAGAMFLAAPAQAAIVLSTESVTAGPGQTGMFDVLLTNTGNSAVNIAGFNFGLSTADTNVSFTGVTTNTATAGYIFANSLFGPDITTVALGQSVEAGDIDAMGVGTDVAAGQTYGLGSVAFTLAPLAMTGDVATLAFIPVYPTTSLADLAGNNIAFDTAPGTITVEPTMVATPEPSELLPMGGILAAAGWLFWKRRTRAA